MCTGDSVTGEALHASFFLVVFMTSSKNHYGKRRVGDIDMIYCNLMTRMIANDNSKDGNIEKYEKCLLQSLFLVWLLCPCAYRRNRKIDLCG